MSSTLTDMQQPAQDVLSETRPLYWCLRRELWENRSLTFGPLIVAAVALFGSCVNVMARLPHRMRILSTLDEGRQRSLLVTPYDMMASVILLTGFVVGAFYCLDALHSERRDRSILFWKSLPLSDRLTVLSKAGIPIAVMPLYTFALALATQLILLFFSTVIVAATGSNPAALWAHVPLFSGSIVMLYGVTIHALWFAPIYGWLLLVSAWAKRATFLWAVLPFFALYVVQKMAFGTSFIGGLLKYRVLGAMKEGFSVDPGKSHIRLAQLDPLGYLTSAGLWTGLLFAAICVALAIRLRRKREPI